MQLVVVEIGNYNNCHLKSIYYCNCFCIFSVFNKELEKDVKGDTSGYFKKLLVSQIQGNRDESPTFDRTAAKKDAKDLFAAGEAKWGTDEST